MKKDQDRSSQRKRRKEEKKCVSTRFQGNENNKKRAHTQLSCAGAVSGCDRHGVYSAMAAGGRGWSNEPRTPSGEV